MRKWRYFLDQYRRARAEVPTQAGLAQAREMLSPQLYDLFTQMMPYEQAHSIRVMDKLAEQGYQDPDLLAAALLHDIGKVRHPLRPWERGLSVILSRLLPRVYQSWGKGEPAGLKAGVVVRVHHAKWGAEMAEQAGANPRLVWLIRNHDQCTGNLSSPDLELLLALKRVDSTN